MLAAGAGALATPRINRGRYRLFAGAGDYSARTIRLMQESLVIDMLSPLTLSQSRTRLWNTNAENFTEADFRQFRESGIHVFHVASGTGPVDAFRAALDYLGGYNSLMAGRDEFFLRIDSPGDFARARTSGKIGVLLGMQNSEHFATLDDVDYFYWIGQRVSQLTYNWRNRLGNGATERHDDGISDYGAAVIERMNRVGMAVDTSHCGDRTTIEACEVSRKPVLITHANARGLIDHPRAKPDAAIRKMAASGGVMGISGVRNFVRDREPTTIEHVIDHFDYVRKLVGVEHLGVGSDMDLLGYDRLPAEEKAQMKAGFKQSYGFREKSEIEGLDHPKRMFDLTEALGRRGYSDAEITAILGGNFKRVLTEIWTPSPPATPPANR
jgi:membrane dipeptidase